MFWQECLLCSDCPHLPDLVSGTRKKAMESLCITDICGTEQLNLSIRLVSNEYVASSAIKEKQS